MPRGAIIDNDQVALNAAFWGRDLYLQDYLSRVLKPAEIVLLLRFRRQLSGRVLEIGCGAGRLLGYLLELSDDVHGIDVAPSMVRHCELMFPQAHTRLGDLRSLEACLTGRFDAIIAADNVLDVLDDATRRSVLLEMRTTYLQEKGLLIFSSHNLDAMQTDRNGAEPGLVRRTLALGQSALRRPPAELLDGVFRLRRRRTNRRRLQGLQKRADDYAILNDVAHDYALLHYYIGSEAQASQFRELGYEPLSCLELDGTDVAAGDVGRSSALYYVAGATSGSQSEPQD